MKQRISKSLYWTPRILSILFIMFLALFSLDVFEPGLTAGQIALALFMHNIPVIILALLLIISWRYEIVGGITFILAGLLYIAMLLTTAIRTGFEWYYLSWAIQIAGIAFVIGILWLMNWRREKK